MCLGPNLFKASHVFRSDLPSLKNNLEICALVAAAKLARLANHALVLLLKRYYAVRASTIVCPTLSRLARSASSLQIWFLSPAPIVCGAPFATDQGRVEPDPSVAKQGRNRNARPAKYGKQRPCWVFYSGMFPAAACATGGFHCGAPCRWQTEQRARQRNYVWRKA